MLRGPLCVIAIAFAALVLARAGQNTQPAETPSDGNVVFRVSSTYVQVDAEVTDKAGHHVKDLGPSDFEVLLDGKSQPIASATWVALDAADVNRRAFNSASSLKEQVTRPQDVRRSMVLVVDDVGLSFTSMAEVKQALHRFVDQNMHPGDLFSLWETGRFNSVFQQFTSDKHLLQVAIDNLRWNSFNENINPAVVAGGDPEERASRFNDTVSADMRNEMRYASSDSATAVLATLRELVDELQDVGGRKGVVLLSEGLDLGWSDLSRRTSDPLLQGIQKSQRELIDQANRSGTVFYAMDLRALVALPPGPQGKMKIATAMFGSQQGIEILAQETGGFAVVNGNGLQDFLTNVYDDQKGYYLISFKAPDDIKTTTGGELDFRRLKVVVKRDGVKVRSRGGFLGATDQVASVAERSQDQMRVTMGSLFNRADIGVRLAAFYTRAPVEQHGKHGHTSVIEKPAVRNLIYVDPKDLEFVDEATGKHKAVFELRVVATGPAGATLASEKRDITIEGDDAQIAKFRRDGALYEVDISVPHSGPYQVRAAVRDLKTSKIGSAGEYIDIPDLQKQHVALTTPVIDVASLPPGTRFRGVSAALRQFQAGTPLQFVSAVQSASGTRVTIANASVELMHNGAVVVSAPVRVVPVDGENRSALTGELKLSLKTPPGEYYLRAIATATTDKGSETISNSIDFEVFAAGSHASE